MQNQRLGEILLARKLVTRGQLEDALTEQKESPERLLGHILVNRGFLSHAELIRIIVNDKHLPMAHAVLDRVRIANQATDEHGVPLLRVSTGEAAELAMPEKEFPVPRPVPELADFSMTSETEKELASDAFEAVEAGRLDEARQIITQGLTILSDSIALLYLSAWLQAADGREKSALEVLEKHFGNQHDNASVIWLLAWCQQKLDNHRAAVAQYQRLLRRAQPLQIWYYCLAYSLDDLGYHKKAREVYTYYVRIMRGENRYTWFARQRLREIIEQHDTD
ncbi:MAG: hypothetical protein LAT62_02610 [Natronospirillum sp.]|uniref:hypothetical protein n=1 Tax=Natronospirillum sp. TaxID=2812955 RepID=UPI0025CC77E8|nr:hypothetical protein [Natronospirillum sp.]MCH8550800.1 hypothetical protein [Natronospirillum sp.]